jgi:hypothetical protein
MSSSFSFLFFLSLPSPNYPALHPPRRLLSSSSPPILSYPLSHRPNPSSLPQCIETTRRRGRSSLPHASSEPPYPAPPPRRDTFPSSSTSAATLRRRSRGTTEGQELLSWASPLSSASSRHAYLVLHTGGLLVAEEQGCDGGAGVVVVTSRLIASRSGSRFPRALASWSCHPPQLRLPPLLPLLEATARFLQWPPPTAQFGVVGTPDLWCATRHASWSPHSRGSGRQVRP